MRCMTCSSLAVSVAQALQLAFGSTRVPTEPKRDYMFITQGALLRATINAVTGRLKRCNGLQYLQGAHQWKMTAIKEPRRTQSAFATKG